MTAIALALGASLAWGASDFLAGTQSRLCSVLSVLLLSQVFGLALALPVALAFGGPLPGTEAAAWALGAGVAEVAAFAALYRGLATGAMSLIAPLSATAGLVPLLVGLASGEALGAVQWAGVALALVGVVLAMTEGGTRPRIAQGCGLALLAALGFGLYFVGMDQAADGGALWAAVLNRWASLAVLALAVCVLRRNPSAPRGSLVAIVLVGTLDIAANVLFASALTHGLAGVVSVLGSLYPVTTLLLAQVLLDERLARIQGLGVGSALAGVALLSLAA